MWRQLKAIVLLPAAVTLPVPAGLLWLTSSWEPGWSLGMPLDLLPIVPGALVVLAGLVLWLRCVTLFSRVGKGTLAPWDPPRKLVVEGVYRHVRNPMITGVLAVLLGEAILFGSWAVAAWFLLFWLANLVFIVKVEEPALVDRFGRDYVAYVKNVPRWIPRIRPWEPGGDL